MLQSQVLGHQDHSTSACKRPRDASRSWDARRREGGGNRKPIERRTGKVDTTTMPCYSRRRLRPRPGRGHVMRPISVACQMHHATAVMRQLSCGSETQRRAGQQSLCLTNGHLVGEGLGRGVQVDDVHCAPRAGAVLLYRLAVRGLQTQTTRQYEKSVSPADD